MVAAESDAHDVGRVVTALRQRINNDNLLRAANSENACLGRVDNGREVLHVVHAQVANGEGAALELLGLERVLARTLRQGAHVARNVAQVLDIGIKDNGRDEASIRAHCHANIDNIVLADERVHPCRVALGHGTQCRSRRLDYKVVDRQLVLTVTRCRCEDVGRGKQKKQSGERV